MAERKTLASTGMQTTVGSPQVPAWQPHRVHSPAYNEDMDIVRQNVLLKNGTTVAIDDYNEDVHGPSVQETDDEYRMRMMAQPSGRPGGTAHMPTTLPNLATFNSALLPQLQQPSLTPPPTVIAGQPVATTDEPLEGIINPVTLGAPGRVVTVDEAKALQEDQREADADMANRAAERRTAAAENNTSARRGGRRQPKEQTKEENKQ